MNSLPSQLMAFDITAQLIWNKISIPNTNQAMHSCDEQQFYLAIPGVARFLALPHKNSIVIEKEQDKEDELKLEFMNYFVKGRLPPSTVIEKLKLNDLWIHMRLYAVPEGKAKYLREGGIFYDYNKVKECFTGAYDKTKPKVENNREFKFCQQPFDTYDTKKNLLKTVKAMEEFIDEGGNRGKPKKKRSKTPKRLKDD